MAKIEVPSASETARKWAEVTPGRSAYYEAGVRSPAYDWETRTLAAKSAYKAAISAADIGERFAGGVKAAGSEKWARKAIDLGVPRFGPGVRAATEDFSSGIAPYLEELGRIDLPERAPRGDPANLRRVEAVATALHKKRLAMIGGV